MNLEFVFKVIEKEEWVKAKEDGIFYGSSKDINDGYIHFSEEEQIKETLQKYFTNKDNLILLKVHTLNLEHLLWEQASNGDMYPHLYSSLEIKNVVAEYELNLDCNGTHELPKSIKS